MNLLHLLTLILLQLSLISSQIENDISASNVWYEIGNIHTEAFFESILGTKPFEFNNSHARFLYSKLQRVIWPMGKDPHPNLPFLVYNSPSYGKQSMAMASLLRHKNWTTDIIPGALYNNLKRIGNGEFGVVFHGSLKNKRYMNNRIERKRPRIATLCTKPLVSRAKVEIPSGMPLAIKLESISLPADLNEQSYQFEASSLAELKALCLTNWLSLPKETKVPKQDKFYTAPKRMRTENPNFGSLYSSSGIEPSGPDMNMLPNVESQPFDNIVTEKTFVHGGVNNGVRELPLNLDYTAIAKTNDALQATLNIETQSHTPSVPFVDNSSDIWNIKGTDRLSKLAFSGHQDKLMNSRRHSADRNPTFLSSVTELFVQPYGVYFSAPGDNLFKSGFGDAGTRHLGWMYIEMEFVQRTGASISQMFQLDSFMFEWIFGEAAAARYLGISIGDRSLRNMGAQYESYSRIYHIGSDSYFIDKQFPLPKRFDLGIITKYEDARTKPQKSDIEGPGLTFWERMKKLFCFNAPQTVQFDRDSFVRKTAERSPNNFVKPSIGRVFASNPFYGVLEQAKLQGASENAIAALEAMLPAAGTNIQAIFQKYFGKFLITEEQEAKLLSKPCFTSNLNEWNKLDVRHYYF